MIVFKITPPPSANRMWANRKGGGKRLSPEYELWLSVAGWEMNQQSKWEAMQGHYSLLIEVDAGRADVDNLIKPTNDLMQKMKVVVNDRNCKQVTITDQGYCEQDHDGLMLVVIKPMEKLNG